MNVPRSLVALGAAGVLATGGTVAVNAASSAPTVALCVQQGSNIVFAASNGGCTTGMRPVTVSSGDAVAALDARISALEDEVEPRLVISTTEPHGEGDQRSRDFHLVGHNLYADQLVRVAATGAAYEFRPDKFGTLDKTGTFSCSTLPFGAVADAWGENGETLHARLPTC